MPSRLSDAQANNSLDVRFGGVESTAPDTYYFGLATTAPSDNVGTGLVEPSTGGYTRVALINNATNFPAATARSKTNAVPITYPYATGDWGDIVGVPYFSELTSGTFLGYSSLPTPVAIDSGMTAQISIGDLTFSSSGT
jgi:hypothetical protein